MATRRVAVPAGSCRLTPLRTPAAAPALTRAPLLRSGSCCCGPRLPRSSRRCIRGPAGICRPVPPTRPKHRATRSRPRRGPGGRRPPPVIPSAATATIRYLSASSPIQTSLNGKRVLLAIVLSFVVLYGYQAMFPPPEPLNLRRRRRLCAPQDSRPLRRPRRDAPVRSRTARGVHLRQAACRRYRRPRHSPSRTARSRDLLDAGGVIKSWRLKST